MDSVKSSTQILRVQLTNPTKAGRGTGIKNIHSLGGHFPGSP